jgi:hypothetical protein
MPKPEMLVCQLSDLVKTQPMPDWLTKNIQTITDNIDLCIPEEKATDLPSFIYFH